MSWGAIDKVGRWRIITAGAIGGLAASYVMNEFGRLLKSNTGEQPSESEDATVRVARAISQAAGIGEIVEQNKEAAGAAVHYSMGTLAGAVYGAAASEWPVVTSGFGTAYGSAVWLLGDETMIPALGLAPSLTETPLTTHFSSLAAHCVYGFVTDLILRGFIKKIWPLR